MKYSVEKEKIIWAEIECETLIINTDTGFYYSLDEVGCTVWNLLAYGHEEDEIVLAITSQYEVDETTARQDLCRLLENLQREQLIEKQ